MFGTHPRERGDNLADAQSRRKRGRTEFLDAGAHKNVDAPRHEKPVRGAPLVTGDTDDGGDEAGGRPDASDLALAEVLPETRVGKAAIDLITTVETLAPGRGHYAAMSEATRALRQLRSLHSRQRRFVADALHHVVRLLRRLRALAAVGETSGKRTSATMLYVLWLFEKFVPIGAKPSAALAALLARFQLDAVTVQDLRDRLAATLTQIAAASDPSPLSPDEVVTALGEGLSYPAWLVRAFLDSFGWDPAGCATTLRILSVQNERAPLTVRVNRLLATPDQAAARLAEAGLTARRAPMATAGLYLEGHANVYATAPFADGWIELQDEGSQLIADVCAPPPGGVIVDACAGAGGKTLALGALLESRGRLLAIDVDRRKLEELSRRCRRAGLTNVQALCLEDSWTRDGGAGRLPAWLTARGADRVLVDAPCSGLGVLRRNPEARWRLRPGDLDELPATQLRLLTAAATLVRPHGRLIYATCTVLRRENEEVVARFLASHPHYAPVPIKEILGAARVRDCSDGDGVYLRTLPTLEGPDGFFAAVLRRVG